MKRAKYLYSAIIVVCLIIIIWSTYYTLGGFDPVEIYVMEGKQRTVIGKEYIEKYEYDAFHGKMQQTIAEIDSGRLVGMLTVVFFENDTIGKDSVHYFMGASVDAVEEVLRLPAGYDFKEFKTDQVFKLFMTQHWLVQPLPEEVAEMMQIKSIEEGKVLAPYWFELYYKDQSLSVEYWAR